MSKKKAIEAVSKLLGGSLEVERCMCGGRIASIRNCGGATIIESETTQYGQCLPTEKAAIADVYAQLRGAAIALLSREYDFED